MKIAILGAGNGGCASACHMKKMGHEVTLCSARNPEHIKPVIEKGGLELSGVLGEEFVELNVTTDVKEAIEHAELIMLVMPATAHEFYAKKIAPYLHDRQVIFLSPGATGGSLNVARILREVNKDVDVKICETNTLPYACRLLSPTQVKIYHLVHYLLFATFPSKYSEEIFGFIKPLYPAISRAENVLETGLANLNAIMHPAGMILDAGWIEQTKGDFYFYYDGTSPAVGRVIEAVDRERLEVLNRLGIRSKTFVELFYLAGYTPKDKVSVYEAIRNSPADRYIRAPPTLNHRYLTEDIPFGLGPISLIAKEIGVKTPIIDSLINLASEINQTNYWETSLSPKQMGIQGLNIAELKNYLSEGRLASR
jgi:opine dehydrogenase